MVGKGVPESQTTGSATHQAGKRVWLIQKVIRPPSPFQFPHIVTQTMQNIILMPVANPNYSAAAVIPARKMGLTPVPANIESVAPPVGSYSFS